MEGKTEKQGGLWKCLKTKINHLSLQFISPTIKGRLKTRKGRKKEGRKGRSGWRERGRGKEGRKEGRKKEGRKEGRNE
jgi:hypothetical protein